MFSKCISVLRKHMLPSTNTINTDIFTPQDYTEVNVILKLFEVKVKVKFIVVQAMKTQRGCRGITLLFL